MGFNANSAMFDNQALVHHHQKFHASQNAAIERIEKEPVCTLIRVSHILARIGHPGAHG